jgi:hypothetical protein
MEEIGKAITVLSEGLSSLAKGIDMITKHVDKMVKEHGKITKKVSYAKPVKKVTSKKTGIKKPIAKKMTAKKSVAKKIITKKVTPKKQVRRQVSVGKPVATSQVNKKLIAKKTIIGSSSKAISRRGPAKKVYNQKKVKAGKTNFDTVFELIQNSSDNVTNSLIMEKTGFRKRQVADILFKLKKQHKIKNVRRGIYAPM